MSSKLILGAVLGLSLSGCVAYGGDDRNYYRQYDDYYGGHVQRYESRPIYRGYYDDNRRAWHRDRYQDRRHSHYAPGYDGRYGWQDGRPRNQELRGAPRAYHEHTWQQRREHDRDRRQSWQPRHDRWQQGYRQDPRQQRHDFRPPQQRPEGRGERRNLR